MYSDIPKPVVKTNIKLSTKATSKEGVRKNIEWLKKHHHEYYGQCIALNEGVLLGSNENALELYKAMRNGHEITSRFVIYFMTIPKNSGQLPVALFIDL